VRFVTACALFVLLAWAVLEGNGLWQPLVAACRRSLEP
jgi:hypothetical protein